MLCDSLGSYGIDGPLYPYQQTAEVAFAHAQVAVMTFDDALHDG
jgi:hypothetical protein